jgi:hypothetical protein
MEKEDQMARKSKRQVRTRKAATVSSAEFNPDYSDIKKDLKNISILAGSFIFILVVLSFFLN